jgi:hypothetical protein
MSWIKDKYNINYVIKLYILGQGGEACFFFLENIIAI